MEIKTAEFVVSNADTNQCPRHNLPEYAFIGRSNVGKSSLINMLCNRKDLAKTSSKPGKTQLINHFFINKSWYLVDLPGYGYAKINKEGRDQLHRIIDSYILLRKELTNLFVLIDSRLEPQKIDTDFMEWLGVSQVPFSIVFTKVDKLSQRQLNEKIESYKNHLKETWETLPPIFITSSEKKIGKDCICDYIEQINKEFNQN